MHPHSSNPNDAPVTSVKCIYYVRLCNMNRHTPKADLCIIWLGFRLLALWRKILGIPKQKMENFLINLKDQFWHLGVWLHANLVAKGYKIIIKSISTRSFCRIPIVNMTLIFHGCFFPLVNWPSSEVRFLRKIPMKISNLLYFLKQSYFFALN